MLKLDKEAARQRELRHSAKEVFVEACHDLAHRILLEQDDVGWLRYYFADLFWYPFVGQQIEMIEAIAHVIRHGGDQAIAASRGEGKTKICERVLLKYALSGEVSFAVLFAATGAAAQDSLDSIKRELEGNDRLLLYYPEVCRPIRALENTPNRAHYQIVTGKRHDNDEPYVRVPSKFSWCGHEVTFPAVPGSPSAGSIFATRGLDAAVRGLNKGNRRPSIACIDDPDTEETARSEDQAKKLEYRIDSTIGGMGGQQKSIGRVMLTTIQNRTCVSFRYTDPKQKSSWKGKRLRFLVSPPDRGDLWDEYIQLRIAGLQTGDEFCREAHAFYLANREAMDHGAAVANKHRYDPSKLADGSQVEVSALQRYYNEVSRLGLDAVQSEYDNDPAEELGPVESGITPTSIQKKCNGYPRTIVPPDCTKVTRGIDCRKVALHWVVRAWRADGTGFTIDYGVHEIHGTTYGSDEGLDVALKKGILAYLDDSRGSRYQTADGETREIDRTLIDAGWRTDAVYSACGAAGAGVWPVMGEGSSAGCILASNFEPQKKSFTRQPGDNYYLTRKGKLWLVVAKADHWKSWEHDRWITGVGKPGAMTIFGEPHERGDRLSDDEKSHHSYARHICNEVEIEEPYKGTIRRRWKAKSENTHWLDASYYSDVAAAMEGIRVLAAADPKQKQKVASQRKTLAQIAGK